MSKGTLQRRLACMRTATIADAFADHVLGVTVGGEELDECALVVCRDEARHHAFRRFFCLCLAHHAAKAVKDNSRHLRNGDV